MTSDIDELLEDLREREANILQEACVYEYGGNLGCQVAEASQVARWIAAVKELVANQLVVKHCVRPDFHLDGERDDGDQANH